MSDVQKAWEEVDSHDHLKKNNINFPEKMGIFNSKVQQQQQQQKNNHKKRLPQREKYNGMSYDLVIWPCYAGYVWLKQEGGTAAIRL